MDLNLPLSRTNAVHTYDILMKEEKLYIKRGTVLIRCRYANTLRKKGNELTVSKL